MIVIIDDDVDTQKLMEKILTNKGMEVKGALSADEALTVCQEAVPELIFMDISLDGTDGLKVAQKIHEIHSLENVPIVAISALAMSGIEERIAQSACCAYLEKPFSPSKLLEVVEKYKKQ